MKHEVEHQVSRTLSWLDESDSIRVSDMFVDTVSSKVSGLHTRRGITYRSRAFYPVVVLLMLVLNAAAVMGYLGKQAGDGEQSTDPVSIVASEYGIGQSGYAAF